MGTPLKISADLKVYCFLNGVKLIRPDKIHLIQSTPFFYDTGHTVASILNLALSVTFLNLKGNTLAINEFSAMTSGFQSAKDALGKSILDITKPKSGRIIMQHNREVMDRSRKIIVEETILRKNNTSAEVLAVKSPWYDGDNNVIGLFGCGMRLGVSSLAQSLSLITQVGLLHSYEQPTKNEVFPGKKIHDIYFTSRQCEILQHVVRGKSAKQIASLLKLSHRTIETYLANMKAKLRVSSKSELIDKVFDFF